MQAFWNPKQSQRLLQCWGTRMGKKATYKDAWFALHAKGEAHINAMMAWKEFELREKTNASLMSTLTKELSKQIQESRTYIKTVAEVLLLTVAKNISRRGHRETSNANNRGNFLAILDAIGYNW